MLQMMPESWYPMTWPTMAVICKIDTIIISPGLATLLKPKCYLRIIVEPLLHDMCKGHGCVRIVGARPQTCYNDSLSATSNDDVSKTAQFVSEALNWHSIVIVASYHHDNCLEIRGIGNLSLRPVNPSTTSSVPPD